MNTTIDTPRNQVFRQDYLAFVHLFHLLLYDAPLGNDKYLEYCAHIADDFASSKLVRVIMNMPPGSGKTMMFAIFFIPWLLGHDPKLRIVFCSLDEDLTSDVIRSVRRVMKSKEFSKIFSTRIAREHDTATGFRTVEGGRVIGCCVNGGITGRRGDVIIADDLLAIKQAASAKQVRSLNNIFIKEIATRLAGKGRIFVTMHRLHRNDLTAELIERGGYKRFALPLVATRDHTYEYGGLTWTRKKGEQLRKGHLSEPELRALMEEQGAPDFRLLYQQGVGPEAGFKIKAKNFPFDDPTSVPSDTPIVLSIDTAQKKAETGSFSVILVLARVGANDIVLDQFRSRCSYHELRRAFERLAKKHQPSAVLIEDSAMGSALIQELSDQARHRIVPITPKGSKAKRLRRHLGRIRKGKLRVARGAPWFGDFIGEFLRFPHDTTDVIDAVTMYLDFKDGSPMLSQPQTRQRALGAVAHSGSALPRVDMIASGCVVLRHPSIFNSAPAPSPTPWAFAPAPQWPRNDVQVSSGLGSVIIRKT